MLIIYVEASRKPALTMARRKTMECSFLQCERLKCRKPTLTMACRKTIAVEGIITTTKGEKIEASASNES